MQESNDKKAKVLTILSMVALIVPYVVATLLSFPSFAVKTEYDMFLVLVWIAIVCPIAAIVFIAGIILGAISKKYKKSNASTALIVLNSISILTIAPYTFILVMIESTLMQIIQGTF